MIWGAPIKPLPFKLVVQEREEIWRAGDFWTKEPETIAWIDSFLPGGVFWDIGANIGVFSLYATVKGMNTWAFEPSSDNFDCLKLNFHILNYIFSDEKNLKVHYQHMRDLAFSDTPGKATFHVPAAGAGRSGGQIGSPVDELGRKFTPAETYEVEVTTVDLMAKELGCPDYIKIDVDGHEDAIIAGGVNTLNDRTLKSVLVEVNNNYEKINRVMACSGFTDFNQFNGQDVNRRAGKPQRNVIYTRA